MAWGWHETKAGVLTSSSSAAIAAFFPLDTGPHGIVAIKSRSSTRSHLGIFNSFKHKTTVGVGHLWGMANYNGTKVGTEGLCFYLPCPLLQNMQVFVGNLPERADERDLRDFFKSCGNRSRRSMPGSLTSLTPALRSNLPSASLCTLLVKPSPTVFCPRFAIVNLSIIFWPPSPGI
jgi:hypothetical protein